MQYLFLAGLDLHGIKKQDEKCIKGCNLSKIDGIFFDCKCHKIYLIEFYSVKEFLKEVQFLNY